MSDQWTPDNVMCLVIIVGFFLVAIARALKGKDDL